MKRFFCPPCKDVCRQHFWPRDIVNKEAADPKQRIGTCTRHRRLARNLDGRWLSQRQPR